MPAGVRVELARDFDRQAALLAVPAMTAAAAVVAEGQRRRIPVSRDGSHGRDAGYARDHIDVTLGIDAVGRYWDVGSDATSPDGYPYPLGLELGTPAHEIRSKGGYPLRNAKTGQVFGRVVNHPGTQPYPWCRAALADIVGRVFP